MASIIRIKRTTTAGDPATLGAGELAYSAADYGSVAGGGRLYIGSGTETGGNAASHIVIGGQYFTDMLDHAKGTLTASSALIVDANKKIDDLYVDNVQINGNTVSTTDTNGNLILNPNGTGKVSIASAYTLPRADGTSGQALITNGSGAVSFTTISTTLGIAGDTGTDTVSLVSDTLTFTGSDPIDTTITDNTVTISAKDATTSTKGVASFSATDFSVSSGAVSINAESIQDTVGAMVSSNSETNITVTYDDTNGKLDFSVATATSSVLGVASFNSTDFTVTTGAVSINAESIQDTVGAMVSTNSESGIAVTYDDVNGKLDFNVDDFTITLGGDLTGSVTITNLANATLTATIAANSVALGTDTSGDYVASVGVTAGTGISVSGTGEGAAVTISGIDATSSVKGVASFSATDFTVTSGAVSLNAESIQDTVGAMVSSNSESGIAVTYDDTNGKLDFSVSAQSFTITGDTGTDSFTTGGTLTFTGTDAIDTAVTNDTLTISIKDASTTQKGAASFSSSTFTVTTGAVDVKTGGISNTQLVNSSVTIGSTSVSLGSSATSIAGVTELTVDNLNVNGNTISSTDLNGNITLDPNGTGTVDVSSARITNLADPISAQDAATKAYVDAFQEGLHVHASCDAATTDTLATLTGGTVTYNNGTAGVGATLTLSVALTTVDGYTLQNGNRLLVKDQANAAHNGIYTWATGGTVLTRAADFNTATEIAGGDFTFITNGTNYNNTGWVQTETVTTVGSDNVVFIQFSGAGTYIAGDGLSLTGSTFAVNVAASGGIEISSDSLQLKSTVAGNGLTITNGVIDVVGTADRITVSANAVDIASTYVGQSTITTLGTITTGTWSATAIAANKGGTGLTSFNVGDIIVANGATSLTTLGIGASGKVLQSNGTTLVYGDIDGGTY